VLIVGASVVAGCAAGDLFSSLFGGRNSNERDLNQIDQRNRGANSISSAS
jgi:hypothetical protein